MIRRAIICSVVVLSVAGGLLLAIWNWDQVLWAFEYIQNKSYWVYSLVVILAALAMLVCSWLKVLKQRRAFTPVNKGASVAAPYPTRCWKCITGFWFKTDLCLTRLQERDPRFGPEEQYLVAKDYVVHVELDGGNTVQIITVPRGTVTDLASVPPIFRWYVGRVGRHLEAAIVHDWLYVAWQQLGLLPTDDMRLFSDRIMLAGMLTSGMGCKAYGIYWAIRVFGTCVFYGRNREPYILEHCKMPDCCRHEPTKVSSNWIGP